MHLTRPSVPRQTRIAQLTRSLRLGVPLLLLSLALSAPAALRPPSVPLVACDPYFSIWSPTDKLTDSNTVHWTGKPHHLTARVTIDGKDFRVMGAEPDSLPPMPQTSLEVTPTRTLYRFETGGVRLLLTFMTPALPDDLMVYSRPVTYLTFDFQSTDGQPHEAAFSFSAGGDLAVNTPAQEVLVSHPDISRLVTLSIGSKDQPILARKGDDLRIDWGHLYLAAPKAESPLPATTPEPGSPSVRADAANATLSFASIKLKSKPVSRWLILAYDDEYSIQYFKKNLRPYWRRHGDDAAALLKKSAAEYESLKKRCEKFDADLMASVTRVGGDQYAKICALAYRQCVAANKVVADANGQPLMFPKENFSNGCIGTVDILYPMAPQFLLLSPSLTRAMLVPILDYATSPRWRWPFAPHDLGTYPLANGQVYGGGERTEQNQMPVEETGNMLVLLAALAQIEGNADFCAKYWPLLEKWAEYLQAKGFDPENQLCTDDFAGHLAHNVNLSAKAICGLGAFARLCDQRGDHAKANELTQLARQFAQRWVKESDEGDHSRLAFDKPETWSQKYNLVWDRILGLNLFPDSALRKEMDFYKTKQNDFGLPLDSRESYTKLDWTLWTATLTQNRADFEALVAPVYRFLNESPSRVPMTDWFDTKSAKKSGFQARSVVGGVFLQVLYDRGEWKRWAGCDHAKAANWAPLPAAPKTVVVVPTSEQSPAQWRFTTEPQESGWFKTDFDDSAWTQAPGGFGTRGTPGAVVRTEWRTPGIWLRREIVIPEGKWSDLQLRIHHDDDAEIYVDGTLAAQFPGYVNSYEIAAMRPRAQALLKPGKHLLAVHCKQISGGQYIDVGVVDVQPSN